MKRFGKWFVLIVAVISLAAIFASPPAAAAETDGFYTYTVSNGEATITDVDTAISGAVIIPDTLGGYPVTSIGRSAFYGCSSLQSIEIPSGVTSIGNDAFNGCSSLKSVTFGENSLLESIGEYAFSGCRSLQSIEIPSGVTSIGKYAFSGCTALTEINFNATAMNDLSYNNNYVFYNAGDNGSGITVNIGANVTKIVNNTIITNYYIINNYIYYFRDDGKMTGDGKNEFSPDGYIKGDNEFVNVDGNNYYLVNDRVTEYVGDYDCSTMGHMYGDWSETKKATCTEKGSESRTCEHCDYTETRDIDALGHDFSEPTVTKEATCTENGTRTSSCSRCDETLTTEIDALGHDFELVIDQEPTETEDGKKVWECTRCDETKTEIIPSVNKPSDSESGDTETDGTTDTDKVPVTDSTTVTDGTTSNGDTTSADGTASADGTSADGSSSSTDTTPDVTSGSDSSDALGTDSSDIGGNDKDNDNSSAVWVIFAIVGAVICAALIAAVALSKGKAKADK